MKTDMKTNGKPADNGFAERGGSNGSVNGDKPFYRLILTGERSATRVRAEANGEPVRLTYVQLAILVLLICERGKSGTGYLRHELIYPKAVRVLRQTLNGMEVQPECSGRPGRKKGADNRLVSDEFIETGTKGEYRLKFNPVGAVCLEMTFQELIGMVVSKVTILTQAQYDLLCEVCDRR
jgi:hypothetical protein